MNFNFAAWLQYPQQNNSCANTAVTLNIACTCVAQVKFMAALVNWAGLFDAV